jgi:hypothetical protein
MEIAYKVTTRQENESAGAHVQQGMSCDQIAHDSVHDQ